MTKIWACVVGVCLLASGTGRASGLTLTTIGIDGTFDDWNQVLTNGNQVSLDGTDSPLGAGCYPTNPDRDCAHLVGNGRDVTAFAWTYDPDNIYMYLERLPPASAIMHFVFILDVGADGLANSSDFVFDVSWQSGGTPLTAKLFHYKPANPAGDPMACPTQAACPAPGAVGYVDGYSMPGQIDTSTVLWGPITENGGTVAGTGDKFEVYVPWSALGIAPGTPVFWHVAALNQYNSGGDLTNVVDNVGGPDGKLGTFGDFAVIVTPDYVRGANSPSLVDYCHTITNVGNFTDAYDFAAESTTGSPIAFYTDDGSCGPGQLIALDANGNGSFNDPGDIAPSAAFDSNGDGIPDTAQLVSGTSQNVVVELQVPSGLAGATDTLRVRASSLARPAVQGFATDTTVIGAVSITPTYSESGTPGLTVPFGPFTVQDNMVPDIFDYSVTSAQGWSVSLYADNNGAPGTLLGTSSTGNGIWDPGLPPPNTGAMVPGDQRIVWLQVTIPASAAIGTNDTVTLTATSEVAPARTGSSANTLAALNPLTLRPSYVTPNTALTGSPGTAVFLPHVAINSQATSDTVSLSSAFALASGYTIKWYTDPNGDGNPSDGALITGPFNLAPFGGTLHLVTEIDIPSTSPGLGSQAATLATGLTSTAQAEDDVLVGNLNTFNNGVFSLSSRDFAICDTIYVRAVQLAGSTVSTYQLVYLRPDGTIASSTNMPTDFDGVGFGSYTLAPNDPTGTWTVQIWQSGAPLANYSVPIQVELSGSVALKAPQFVQSGLSLYLTALLSNTSVGAGYVGTSVQFTVTDPSGNSFLTNSVSSINVAQGATVPASTAWPNVNYSASGNYTATATWTTSCGAVLGTATQTLTIGLPPPTLTTPANGSGLAVCNPPMGGTALAGASVGVTLDGVASLAVTADPSGNFSYAPPALPDGQHSWFAVESVGAQTSSPSVTFSFLTDTVAPESAVVIPADGSAFNLANLPAAASGTAVDATSGVQLVEWSLNGGGWTAASGTAQWSAPLSLSGDGVYTMQSRATDAVGNVEATPYTSTFTFDNTPPRSVITAPANGSRFTSAMLPIAVQGTASDQLSGVKLVELSVNGGAWVAASGTGTWSYAFSPVASGSYTITSRATDLALNVETPSSTVTISFTGTGGGSDAGGSGDGGSYSDAGSSGDAGSHADAGSGHGSLDAGGVNTNLAGNDAGAHTLVTSKSGCGCGTADSATQMISFAALALLALGSRRKARRQG